MIGSEAEANNNECRAFSHGADDANSSLFSHTFDVHHHRHCNEYAYDYYPISSSLANESNEMKGSKGEDYSFPVRLHYLLDVMQQDGLAHLACWMPHGRCFVVHNPDEFSQKVLPLWFRQSRFGSFQRQLNLYGFKRMKTGRDKGGYYHASFIRGQPHLAQNIKRIKDKKSKLSDDEDSEEPNFYSIPFVPVHYPVPVIAVQRYAGPNSHYAPQPHQQQQQHHYPVAPAPAPVVPQVAAAAPVASHGAPAAAAPAPDPQAGPAVAYGASMSAAAPHFDAEDMPVIHNENTSCSVFVKDGNGLGEINVPLLQSKLIASPSRHALTQSLTYAYSNKDEAPSPANPSRTSM